MKKVETYEFETEVQTEQGMQKQAIALYKKTDVETEEVTFQGQTQLMHPMVGQIPIGFSIDAKDLEEAAAKYMAHAEVAKKKAEVQINEQIQQAQLAVPENHGNLVGPDGSLLGAKDPKGPKGPMQFPGGKR